MNAASKLGKKSSEKNRPTMTVYTTLTWILTSRLPPIKRSNFRKLIRKEKKHKARRKNKELTKTKKKEKDKRNRRKQRKKKLILIDSRNTNLAMFQRRQFESRENPVREDNNILSVGAKTLFPFLFHFSFFLFFLTDIYHIH